MTRAKGRHPIVRRTDDHAYKRQVFDYVRSFTDTTTALILMDRYDSAIILAWSTGTPECCTADAVLSKENR